MDALMDATRPEASWLATGFVPGLPPLRRRRASAVKPWQAVTAGRCGTAGAGLRVMSARECEAFATAEKKHFLGRSVDKAEYPGCTLWLDTQLVEFNDHVNEGMGCNLAPRGSCICAKETGVAARGPGGFHAGAK